MPVGKPIDRDVLLALTLEHGYDNVATIASALGCHPKTLRTIWRDEHGWRPPRSVARVRRKELEELVRLHGRGPEAVALMAEHFGCHVGSLYRIWREEYGWRRPGSLARVTKEQQARIDVLAREGLPATWIAEDVGVHPATVRDHRPADAPFDMIAWLPVWQHIRRYHLDLHQEFAPKSESLQIVERTLDEGRHHRELVAA